MLSGDMVNTIYRNLFFLYKRKVSFVLDLLAFSQPWVCLIRGGFTREF